ncbi:MAG: hypothetical protein J6N52_03735 [Clostridia bacterium]|nr:hypothetical protein [Clostridia bacterium]
MLLEHFQKIGEGFDYHFSKKLAPGDEVYVKMPSPSPNKRGVNDIGWQTDSDNVTLYGTLSCYVDSSDTIWDEIRSNDDVNKTVYAIKIINSGTRSARVYIRAILY